MHKPRPLHVTPELTREYSDKNYWISGGLRNSYCHEYGPDGGFCTLRRGHGGLIHIAHMRAVGSGFDPYEIYKAWTDGDPDLDMDEGL